MERDDFKADVPSSGRSGERIERGIDRAVDRSEEVSEGLADRARSIAGSTQDRLADVGSSVRERASDLKDSLADALDSGASKLRSRASGSSSSFVGEGGTVAAGHDGRMAEISNNVAGGMSSAASWLRGADIDSMKLGIEKQVREHPGRTLLIAAGLGYLIGKAFRR